MDDHHFGRMVGISAGLAAITTATLAFLSNSKPKHNHKRLRR
jgi:hypothetical protein